MIQDSKSEVMFSLSNKKIVMKYFLDLKMVIYTSFIYEKNFRKKKCLKRCCIAIYVYIIWFWWFLFSCVRACVGACVRACVCVYVCMYFNSSYLRNESSDFRRVKLILFVSRENKGTQMDLRFYWFSFVL